MHMDTYLVNDKAEVEIQIYLTVKSLPWKAQDPFVNFFSLNFFVLFWPCYMACGIFSSRVRSRTCAPCIGSMEAQPLDCWGSPLGPFEDHKFL